MIAIVIMIACPDLDLDHAWPRAPPVVHLMHMLCRVLRG